MKIKDYILKYTDIGLDAYSIYDAAVQISNAESINTNSVYKELRKMFDSDQLEWQDIEEKVTNTKEVTKKDSRKVSDVIESLQNDMTRFNSVKKNFKVRV